MVSFWELKYSDNDFSEEEKTLKIIIFNRFLPAFYTKRWFLTIIQIQKLFDFIPYSLPLTPSFVGSNLATPTMEKPLVKR